jgi:hypothetical protein
MSRLTGEDLGTFKANQGLITYVVEEISGKPCARLVLYRGFAKVALDSAERADLFAVQNQPYGPNVKRFADNQSFLESATANLIKTADADLFGMLKAKKIDIPILDICKLYARLVQGHENDQNCDKIVDELIGGGMQVRARICR